MIASDTEKGEGGQQVMTVNDKNCLSVRHYRCTAAHCLGLLTTLELNLTATCKFPLDQYSMFLLTSQSTADLFVTALVSKMAHILS